MSRILILVALLLPAYLQATTIIVPDDEQLVAKAEAIVVAVAHDVRVVSEDGGVWTESQFVIERTLKGEPRQSVLVREPGGEIEGRRTVIYGAPRFVAGDRVLLFLTEVDGERARVVDIKGVWGQVFESRFVPGNRQVKGQSGSGLRKSIRDARPEFTSSRVGQVTPTELEPLPADFIARWFLRGGDPSR